MKVLWITNDVLEQFLPEVKRGNPTVGGSWIAPLFNSLRGTQVCEMGIVTPVIFGQYARINFTDVTFYTIPVRKNEGTRDIRQETINHYLDVIKDFKPDLIHFHGTERNFGLLRHFIPAEIPIVGSIQGIINSYYPYLFLSTADYKIKKYRSLKNWLGRGGTNYFFKNWKSYCNIEKDIFSVNEYFIGRTLWDKAQALSLNPSIKYYRGEELLREVFYVNHWDINKCERFSIFISSGAYPIKGLHTLLYAISLLIKKYPDTKIYVPLFNADYKITLKDYLFGDDYSILIRSLIKRFRLERSFVPLPRLDAGEMAKRFVRSNVFVLPSFIENSPNALGEAMLVGTPTVVSYTGGIGSIVKNEESTLYFPIGDYRTLAYQIERIFKDDNLAVALSKNAKKIAAIRHDIQKATQQYIDTYTDIIENHNEGSTHF